MILPSKLLEVGIGNELTELEVDETAMLVLGELLCAVDPLTKPARKQFGIVLVDNQNSPQVLRYHLCW